VSSRGGEVVDALPAAVRTDLARLVPELVSVPPSLATDDRFRVYDAVARLGTAYATGSHS